MMMEVNIMSVLLLISVFLSTSSPAHQWSPGGLPNIRHGLSHRYASPYDYSMVYSQPFDGYLLQNGYSNYGAGDRWVCDDFTLEIDADIREVVLYQLYTGMMASEYSIAISMDDEGDSDPNTAVEIWSITIPCENQHHYYVP